MSTPEVYRDFEAVRSRLLTIRTRWKTSLVMRGLMALGVLVLSAGLLVGLLEGLIHLPVVGRVLLLVICLVSLVGALVVWVARPALRR